MTDREGHPNEVPLESWKEIAAYLKRDVRTVKRWEKGEGLPVRRHMHLSRASVYAYPSELDAWIASRRLQVAGDAVPVGPGSRRRTLAALAAVVLLALISVGSPAIPIGATSAAEGLGTISRLLWSGPLVDHLGTPSPDGKYLAITDWKTGNLAIRETATGAIRPLTDNRNWQGWAEFPVPSPDGKQIAYAWFNERGQRDLRVYSLETSSAQVVYAHDEVEYAKPFAWTPDGTRILTNLARTDRTNQIAFITVADGTARVLKSMDWRSSQKLALSPDGQHVAYDFPRKENAPERDIFVMAADGSRDELLVEHPDNDVVLGWTPDGRKLLFGSDRTGRMGIWALPTAEGKALGPPELVRSDVPLLRAMGFTRGGAFYYAVRTGMSDIYVATLDAKTGAVLSPPAPLTPRFVGWNRSPNWSGDGNFVAYVSQREFPPRSVGGGGRTIVVRSLASDEEREITPRLAKMGGMLRWSPDGRSFLVSGGDAHGRTGFFTLSPETGQATLALRVDPPGYVQFPAWSADSKSFYYLRSTPGADNRLRVRNLETGEDREVFDRFINNFALSPDGRSVVMPFGDPDDRASVLAILPVGGGGAKELLRIRQPHVFPPWSGLAWTPDGKHILFSQRQESRPQSFELWRIPADGGTARKTGIVMDQIRILRVHPDGQRIIFSASQLKHEVWVMENFLPQQEASR